MNTLILVGAGDTLGAMSQPPRPTRTASAKATTPKPKSGSVSPVAKALREKFADFFADPARDKLRALLQSGGGETAQLDFKRDWPKSGPLAKHVLAMANSGGGCLVIGVEENEDKSLEPSGLERFTDKANIVNGLKTVIPDALLAQVYVEDFDFEASEWAKLTGRKFQVVLIGADPDHLPHLAVKNGEDLQAGVVYVRREGGSGPASYEELQRLINARIAGGRSTAAELDLKDHLEQLKVIYGQISMYRGRALGFAGIGESLIASMMGHRERNPNYPTESFDAFVLKMVDKKKQRIAIELDVTLDD